MSDITKIKVDGEPESSYQLYPRNEEFAKRAGGNTGSQSGIQSDWNQNDSTQPDYVKNRPFYTDAVETVLIEESTVPFAPDNVVYTGGLESTFSATVGEAYKVYWDGSAYECTCVSANHVYVIGNLSITGDGSDTGEPFIIVVNNGVGMTIATADTSASHTISISGFVREVVKIDEKYLPDTIATKSDVEVAQTTANSAKTTANSAKTTANSAKTTAENAQTTANSAKTTAENAQTTAENAQTTADNAKATADAALPKSGGEISGVIKSSSNIEFPRKYNSYNSTINGLEISSNIDSKVLKNRLRSYGVDSSMFSHIENIVTYLDGIIIYNPNEITNNKTITIAAEGARLDFLNDIGKKPITISAKDIILQSSTTNSTKQFRITVDDSGALTATEAT